MYLFDPSLLCSMQLLTSTLFRAQPVVSKSPQSRSRRIIKGGREVDVEGRPARSRSIPFGFTACMVLGRSSCVLLEHRRATC